MRASLPSAFPMEDPQQQQQQQQPSMSSFGAGRPFHRVMLALLAIVCLASTVGNCQLARAILATRRRRRSRIEPLLLNLCLCDLVIGLLVVPATGYAFVQRRWRLGEPACASVYFGSVTLMFASVFTLTAVSIRRCRGVLRLVRATTTTAASSEPTSGRVAATQQGGRDLAAIWCLGCLAALPNAVNYRLGSCGPTTAGSNASASGDDVCCLESWQRSLDLIGLAGSAEAEAVARTAYSAFIVVALLLIPLSVIAVAHCRICCLVASVNRSLGAFDRAGGSSSGRIKRSHRIFRLSALLVALFAGFWSPIHTWNIGVDLWLLATRGSQEDQMLPPEQQATEYLWVAKDAYLVFMCLALSNSALNPAFLFATDSTYRAWLQSRHCCSRRQEAAHLVVGSNHGDDQGDRDVSLPLNVLRSID